ncbi:MAG: hypothetical protein SFY66_19590 [Oculatellaceae cyanobacterium bins.114]|nr:hypothetical protein [Oculatellaceae cyanobacterium bins.114]
MIEVQATTITHDRSHSSHQKIETLLSGNLSDWNRKYLLWLKCRDEPTTISLEEAQTIALIDELQRSEAAQS